VLGCKNVFGRWKHQRTPLPDSHVFVEHLKRNFVHKGMVLYSTNKDFTAPYLSRGMGVFLRRAEWNVSPLPK